MSQDSRLKVECSTTKRLGDIDILFSYFRLLFSFHDITLSFQLIISPLDKHRTYFYDCRDTAAFSTTRPKDLKLNLRFELRTNGLRHRCATCANPAFIVRRVGIEPTLFLCGRFTVSCPRQLGIPTHKLAR